ncbi:hypothetical protein CL176_10420 [Suicoccus acidiformans]|uniref:DNA-binding protein n=1 Tax=Suicoccus acidiformans TaxID=2036206 RepID=A0A347WNW7_9LACT|nr:hypothetical protein [Suicoccus acidiformans]AXY26774.1 hypothetical protein CL176_10420 [Suicoccus acidiformans]
MRKEVEQLLSNNSISAYKISKEAGVPYMTVNDLRNGKSSIDNAKFGTIEKLYIYALSLQKNSPAD